MCLYSKQRKQKGKYVQTRTKGITGTKGRMIDADVEAEEEVIWEEDERKRGIQKGWRRMSYKEKMSVLLFGTGS